MPVWMNNCARVCAMIVGFGVVVGNRPLAAQSPRVDGKQRPLVIVVGNAVESVRRLGADAIEVKAFGFAKDYDACNAFALTLRPLSVYLVATGDTCPREKFWRERLAHANPQVQVRRIVYRHSAKDAQQRASQQLIAAHQALVATLPQHRETFDVNLAAELARRAPQWAEGAHLAAH